MGSVTEETPVDAGEDTGPALAHYPGLGGDTTVALCGERIMGIPAPKGHPLCPMCHEIFQIFTGDAL